MTDKLPQFEYFPDPLRNGCIVKKQSTCPCCEQARSFMYVGPIYSKHEVAKVCPWCIANGKASSKWSAIFNDMHNVPVGVPQQVLGIICNRTPGYETWQGNQWLFSSSDALVFVGEVKGTTLLNEGNEAKINACRVALSNWNFPPDFDLSQVVIGGQPAIYLFRDKATGAYEAYADMT